VDRHFERATEAFEKQKGSSAMGGVSAAPVESVHAALLLLRQLLMHPGDFMRREATGYAKELYWHHVR
jgi:hypothetical protein